MYVSLVSIPCSQKSSFYIEEGEAVNYLSFNDNLYQLAFWKLINSTPLDIKIPLISDWR